MFLPRKSTINLVVVGSLGSGKTDLFKRLFCRRPASVGGILVGTLKYNNQTDHNSKTIIYKTFVLPAGDSFKGTRARHYFKADAIAIVFNKSRYQTFEEVYGWIEEILSVRKKISLAIIEYTPLERISFSYPVRPVTALDTQKLFEQIKKKYNLTIQLFKVNGTSEESIKKFFTQLTQFVIEAYNKRIATEAIAEEEIKREVVH